jgi:hypothetical protein
VIEEMVVDRIDHELRDLRASGVVEKDECAGVFWLKRGKLGAHRIYRKRVRRGCRMLGFRRRLGAHC